MFEIGSKLSNLIDCNAPWPRIRSRREKLTRGVGFGWVAGRAEDPDAGSPEVCVLHKQVDKVLVQHLWEYISPPHTRHQAKTRLLQNTFSLNAHTLGRGMTSPPAEGLA